MQTILDEHFLTYFRQPLQILLISSVEATHFVHLDHPQALQHVTLKTRVKVGANILNLKRVTNYTNFM